MKFTGFFMGSISANNMNILGKFDYAMSVMVLQMNTMGRLSVSLRASSIGLIVVDGVRCVRSFICRNMYGNYVPHFR
jgi:hypothetical protein